MLKIGVGNKIKEEKWTFKTPFAISAMSPKFLGLIPTNQCMFLDFKGWDELMAFKI